MSYATIKGMSWYQSSNRYCVKDIMSLRPRNNGPMTSTPNHKSSAPPSDLQAAHIASRREAAVTEVVAAAIHNENMSLDSSNGGVPLTMDDLNPVEQAAATLGVNPVAVKPISWLNEKHFNALVSSNALTPCQIVGTPAETVTFSLTIKSRNVFGVMNRWGITCLQPSIEAAKGNPQPIA